MSDYFLEEAQQVSEKIDDQLFVENIANYDALEENISSINKKTSEETRSLSITESLKHGVDYASSILSSANEWLKENDPLKIPVAEAYSVFDEPSPWDRLSHFATISPYPSVNYNPGGPSNIYSPSSSTISSLSSDSVVNRPFAST